MGAMTSIALRDAALCRHDGPVPPDDPAARRFCPRARARLFERLVGEARAAAALRRRALPAAIAPRDVRLGELGRTLAHYRHDGRHWHGDPG